MTTIMTLNEDNEIGLTAVKMGVKKKDLIAPSVRVKYIEGAETRKTTICANSLQILASAKAGLTLDNTSRASLIVIFIQSLSFPEIQIGNLFIFLCV